jgi:uncharacterized repeat protein (TIGR01451 family)
MLAMAEQGRLRCVFAARVWATIVLFLALIASAWALTPMQHGLQWLTAQVKPGGALGNEAASRATSSQNRDESLRTLQQLASGSATPDVSQQDTTSTEYLARQVLSLSAKGGDVSKQLSSLVSRQNSDGGFGLHAGSASIALDSAWALAALAKQPASYSSAIGNLEAWLYGRVQSDGGLDGYSTKDRQQASSLMLLALESLTPDLPARNAIQQLSTWLSSWQAADGSWSEDLYLTAYSLSALAPVSADATLQQSAASYLLGRQASDGSWNADPFLTAVILRALALTPAASAAANGVSGQILSAVSGQPEPGVSVTIAGSAASAISDSNGNFLLSSVPAGSDTLQFSQGGYQPQTLVVAVPANSIVAVGSIFLTPGTGSSVISGTVTDGSNHHAVIGATVTIPGSGQLAISNAQGYYQLAGVSGGSVTLSISAAGYATLTTNVTVGSNGAITYQPVLYPQGSTAIGGNAQLSGQVLAQGSNKPLANVQITANQQTVSTDANGNYTLSLPGGGYTVTYQLAGYSTATAQIAANSGDVASLPVVYLGTQVTNTSISGVITDSATNNPVSGATVQIVGGSTTTTSSAGTYSLSGLTGTQFSLRASATGYNSQNLQIQVNQPATLTQNFALVAQAGQGVSVDPLQATPGTASLNAPIVISTSYHNAGTGPSALVAILQVINAQGAIIGTATAYSSTSAGTPLGQFTVAPGGSQDVVFRWNSGEFSPGAYTLLASASLAGSITRAALLGTVVAQASGALSITPQAKLIGTVSATPPVQQIGNISPVHITASLQSVGNVASGAHTLTAAIVDQNKNQVGSTQATLTSLGVNGLASLDFGAWIPAVAGNFTVNLENDDNTTLTSTGIYVGVAATGVLTITPQLTSTGSQTVQGTVALQGIDPVSASLMDPDAVLIRNALQGAVPYNDNAAATWINTASGNCAGCHIAAQGIIGGELNNHLASRNAADRNIMLNAVKAEENVDGTYSTSASGFYIRNSLTQTLLNQWGMTAWENLPDVIDQLVFSANYVSRQQGANGGWTGDTPQAWWYDDYSTNALAAYNLNHVSQALAANPTLPVNRRLGAIATIGGQINKSGLCMDANCFQVDSQGNSYVEQPTNNADTKFLKIAPDGSQKVILDLWGGAIPMVVRGNYLYLSDGYYGNIQVYDLNGSAITSYSSLHQFGTFDVDGQGNLYLMTNADGVTTVYRYANGVTSVAGQAPAGYYYDRIKVTDTGVIYLQGSQRVIQVNPDNTSITLDTTSGSGGFARLTLDSNQRPVYFFEHAPSDIIEIRRIDASNNVEKLVGYSVYYGPTISALGGMPDGSIVALEDASYYFNNGVVSGGYSIADIMPLVPGPQYTAADTLKLTAAYKTSLQNALSYWQHNLPLAGDNDNLHYAFALIALGNIADSLDRSGQTDQAAQAKALMPGLVAALKQSQILTDSGPVPDAANDSCARPFYDIGSWGNYSTPSISGGHAGTPGDTMVTAIVGYALQYAPVNEARDLMIRQAIKYELSNQRCDHSWKSGMMATQVAATTWVSIFLPIALNQITGINSDLYLTFPSSNSLGSPSALPTDTQHNSDGSTRYHWNFANLQLSGETINFNLGLANLLPNEVRQVATDAHLSFTNSYTGNTVDEALAIPTVTASDGLGLTVGTDQPSYGANNPVAITAAVSNTGAGVQGGSVHLVIYAAIGTRVADLGSQPFAGLPAQGTSPVNASWNTGTLLPNAYYVQATLVDASGNTVSTTQSNFSITSSSATGLLIGAGVSTDKASYGPLDTVQLDDRITNLTSNTLAGSLTLATTITGPSGSVVWTHSDSLQQLTAGNYKDFTASIPVSSAADGIYNVSLVVTDSSGAQQASAHNSYKVQSTATSGQGIAGTLSISAATLKNRQLTVGDTLMLTASISNQGNAALSNLPVTISIIDPASGSTLAHWTDSISSLATGGSSPLTHTWSSSGSNNQALVAVVSSSFTSNTLLAQAPFSLVVPPLTLSYNADKASYDINSTVSLTSTINSQSALALTGLTLNEQITGPNNSVFWQHSVSGQTVSASTPLTYPDSVPLGLAAPGTYTATLSVLSANGVLQAQGATHFTVNSSASNGAGVSGSLSAPASIVAGSITSIGYSLTDAGNAALGNLPVQILVTNTTTGVALPPLTATIASLAQGSTLTGAPFSWSSQGLVSGTTLKLTLQAQFGSGWVTLGSQSLTLTKPPVNTSLSAPAASYGYSSPVAITATLSNPSLVNITPATVIWTLTGPTGTIVDTRTTSANLPAASGTPGSVTLAYSYTFATAAPGSYILSASVSGNGESFVAPTPVQLVVSSTAQTGAGVSGALSGFTGLTAGASVPFSYTISDAGNAALSNLPVQVLVSTTSVGSSTPLATLAGTLAALAVGSTSAPATLSWSSSGVVSGTPLQATLQVQVGSGWITLDTQSFTLAKPALTASLGTPAASYAYNTPVNIPLALGNQSPVVITPATVTWTLTDPSGHAIAVSPATASATVPAATGSGSSLVPGTASVAFTYTFGSATPGTYTLGASVSGNSESLAAAAPVSLVVTSTALTGAGISGQLGTLSGNTAGTSVPISFTVADIGNAPLSNQPVRVVIANVATGQTLASPATTLASVAMGGTPASGSVSWDSSGTVSGAPLTATLQAQFNGSWINLAPAQAFALVKPVVKATLGSPAASYAYNGLVSIPLTIVNQSPVTIAPATVGFTLSNATGTIINTATATVASLGVSGSAGSTATATYTYTFVSAAPGNYSLAASVSGNGENLVSATPVTLVVSSTAQTGAGLSATLSATPTAPSIGQTVVLGESLSNAGNAALTNLPLTLTLSQGTTVVQTFSDMVTSLAAGALNQSLAHNWVPTAAGTYTEKLTATVGTNILTLATGTITVAQTPVKISVTPVAGSHGRVLVYLSCKPGEREGQGNPNNPNNACLTQRQATLASYFGSFGVSYSVVTDDDAFTLALRSGRYNSYWLLGSITPVEDDLVDELREAVNRGDSLVIDSGLQGNANYALFHIAGVSYQGHLTFGSNSLSFTAPVYSDLVGTNLSSASGWTWFSVYSGSVAAYWNGSQNPHGDNDHEPGNDDPSGWNQCGWNYGSNNGNSGSGWNNGSNGGWSNGSWSHGSSTQYPAIVSNQYGQGKTLALAFDLVASLQAVGTTTTPVNGGWSKLLADSLGYSTPAALSRALIPGEAYSASFPVQNQGQAVNLYANLVQPTGGSYLGANLTGIAQSNGSEQFSLGLASSQTLNLITDQLAPASSGSYNLNLSAQTNATPPTSLGSFVYSLSVGATQASRQSTVNSEINAIPLTLTNTLSLLAAKSYYASAQGALSLGNVGGAIDALADAGEALSQISGTQASTARADLDLLLKLVESRWQPPVKPGNGH